MADSQPNNTVVPTLMVNGAAEALGFYTKALGAKEVYRMPSTDGKKIMHAAIEIGNSQIYISDVLPEMGSSATQNMTFYIYVDDVDAAFKKAVDAGAKEKTAPKDMFWGDRNGSVNDPYGVHWTFAKHIRDVSSAEIKEAMKKMENKAA